MVINIVEVFRQIKQSTSLRCFYLITHLLYFCSLLLQITKNTGSLKVKLEVGHFIECIIIHAGHCLTL